MKKLVVGLLVISMMVLVMGCAGSSSSGSSSTEDTTSTDSTDSTGTESTSSGEQISIGVVMKLYDEFQNKVMECPPIFVPVEELVLI
ncbi:MAG: hypothetical protein ACK5MN_12915 [Lachnospiraceae bacterium]